MSSSLQVVYFPQEILKYNIKLTMADKNRGVQETNITKAFIKIKIKHNIIKYASAQLQYNV
jgi:hypothetical protein